MTVTDPPHETLLDKAAVLVVGVMVAGLYVTFGRLLIGSWPGFLGPSVAGLVYVLGLSTLTAVERRRQRPLGRWVLSCLPVFGALAGLLSALIEPEAPGRLDRALLGAFLGALHAAVLYHHVRQRGRTAPRSAA